ncbi:MAG: PIN domain-containing protein [Gemmatimonadota bacterium]|nr:PIN domain-containing protein [Gemmatimonadota bacterium]
MIALDSNVVLRLMVRDHPAHEAAAGRLFAAAARAGTPRYVADAVLCEVVWVLRSRYGIARGEAAAALAALAETAGIVLEGPDAVERAIAAYREGRGDFADYLIRERAAVRGATETVTFDRALKGEPGFRILP